MTIVLNGKGNIKKGTNIRNKLFFPLFFQTSLYPIQLPLHFRGTCCDIKSPCTMVHNGSISYGVARNTHGMQIKPMHETMPVRFAATKIRGM